MHKYRHLCVREEEVRGQNRNKNSYLWQSSKHSELDGTHCPLRPVRTQAFFQSHDCKVEEDDHSQSLATENANAVIAPPSERQYRRLTGRWLDGNIKVFIKQLMPQLFPRARFSSRQDKE